MNFQNVVKTASALTLALLLAGPAPASEPIRGPEEATVNWYAPDRASTLLKQLHQLNGDISKTGDILEASGRTTTPHWQSHAGHLASLRENINRAGAMLTELQDIRSGALPWQRQAIDRIVPIAVDLAAHTQAAITHLRNSPHQLFVPEYTEHLAAIADRATEIQQTVKNFIEYGEAQRTIQQLDQSLELSDS